MSDKQNDKLVDEIAEYIERYTNTTAGKMLGMAFIRNDYERCYEILQQLKENEYYAGE